MDGAPKNFSSQYFDAAVAKRAERVELEHTLNDVTKTLDVIHDPFIIHY